MAGIENRIICVRVDIQKDKTAVVSDVLGNGEFIAVYTPGSVSTRTDMAIFRSRLLGGVPFVRFNHALSEEVFNAKAARSR